MWEINSWLNLKNHLNWKKHLNWNAIWIWYIDLFGISRPTYKYINIYVSFACHNDLALSTELNCTKIELGNTEALKPLQLPDYKTEIIDGLILLSVWGHILLSIQHARLQHHAISQVSTATDFCFLWQFFLRRTISKQSYLIHVPASKARQW